MSYDFLGRATADGSAMTLTVSGIPQTHKDLEIICHVISDTAAASSGKITVNGDSGGNYRRNGWRINGTTLYGIADIPGSGGWDINFSQGSGAFGGPAAALAKIYLSNYSTAVDHPGSYQSTSWDSYTSGEQAVGGLLYDNSSPAAITSITWTGVYTIKADCTITVYGIDY